MMSVLFNADTLKATHGSFNAARKWAKETYNVTAKGWVDLCDRLNDAVAESQAEPIDDDAALAAFEARDCMSHLERRAWFGEAFEPFSDPTEVFGPTEGQLIMDVSSIG